MEFHNVTDLFADPDFDCDPDRHRGPSLRVTPL